MTVCATCHGAEWLCEEHPDRPWPHDQCPGPGVPCPRCNTEDPPRALSGFRSHVTDAELGNQQTTTASILPFVRRGRAVRTPNTEPELALPISTLIALATDYESALKRSETITQQFIEALKAVKDRAVSINVIDASGRAPDYARALQDMREELAEISRLATALKQWGGD